MKTFKKSLSLSTLLLMAASMGSAYADEEQMTQERTREHAELNLQIPESDSAQARQREQKMVINKNAAVSEYEHEGDMIKTRTQTRQRSEFNLETPTSDFAQSRNSEQYMVSSKGENQNPYQYKHMNKYQHSYAGASTMNRAMQNSTASSQAYATRSKSTGRR